MSEDERRRMPGDTPEWAGDDPLDSWPVRADDEPDDEEQTEDPLAVSELEPAPAAIDDEPELPPATDDELAHEGEPEDAAELEERALAEHAAGEVDVPDGYTVIEGY